MVEAFSPANISCIFRIVENENLEKKHSLGVGFTINKGVIVSVKENKKNRSIFLSNNKRIKFPTVEAVVKKLTKKSITVKIKSELPFGAGFGLSGACALATAYALNKLLKLKKKKKDLAMIAHIAEVENKTGLGDVRGQFNGGVMLKFVKGCPLEVKRLSVKEKYVYYKTFSKLSTKSIISDKRMRNKINKAGDRALGKIRKLNKATLKNIIKISKEFAVESALLKNKKVINLIKKIEENNGAASMIMLGNAVYSDSPFEGSRKVKISKKSACLI